MQRFRGIQPETYPVERTNDSDSSFYDMRNDQIEEYEEMSSINNPDNTLKLTIKVHKVRDLIINNMMLHSN